MICLVSQILRIQKHFQIKRYTRNGSIIVFHDSLKAQHNMQWALPRAIEWLKSRGYEFDTLPM